MNSSIDNKRIWELDFLRGIALIFMVYFHVVFDMNEIFGYSVSYTRGINSIIGDAAGILFIFISGVSCTLSRSNLKRGLRVLAIALGITLATHLYNPDLGIKFGILHFLGTSMLLYTIFVKLNRYLLIFLGILIIITGYYIDNITVSHNYLFPLGIYSSSFNSSDYYPMIPWFGLFLFGNGLGKFLYFNKKSVFNFTIPDNIISIAGRRTLLVYIIHQPLILFVLTIAKNINILPG